MKSEKRDDAVLVVSGAPGLTLGVRSRILKHLYEHPKMPSGRYWTPWDIANALPMARSTVWKITKKFRDCGVLEPQPPTRVPLGKRMVDARGLDMVTTAQTYRTRVPCHLTDLGRRLWKLMNFAREQRIFDIEPQKRRLANNDALLGKFKQGGFTAEEVRAAVDCGLIYEEPSRSYTPREGFQVVTLGKIVSALAGSQERQVEYRYKYRLR